MSPQFVDFNADGHIDIVAGTFDGSPHVSLGSKAGFTKPTHILNEAGKRIISGFYWDYGARKWTTVGKSGRSQITSAFAYDWEGDGDYDLLLGDYAGGRIYLCVNNGTNKAPKFATSLSQVQVGGTPFKSDAKLATMRMVDWDGDGKLDLVAGTMGNIHGAAKPAKVIWHRNIGEKGATVFAAGEVLLASKAPVAGVGNGSHFGYYFDLTDVDGDGDLDILVGGKSVVMPKGRKLSAEEAAEAKQLAAKLSETSQKLMAIYRDAQTKAGDRKAEGWRKRYSAAIAARSAELRELRQQSSALRKRHDALVPRKQVVNRVWLHLNGKASATTDAPKADEKAYY